MLMENNLARKPYFLLFNAITDALDLLEVQNFGQARETLIRAQQEAEELMITEDDSAPNG